jgi:hypothetical protein
MAMGKRRRHAKQTAMWVATNDVPRSAGHPFYTRLHQILDAHNFDGYVEDFVPPILRGRRPARAAARPLLSAAADRLFRGPCTRRLIDLETHDAVFTWMLQRLGDTGAIYVVCQV